MTTEYLGVKQVAERLGVANAAVYDLKPSTGGTREVPAEASAAADHANTRSTNKPEARKTIPGFLCFMGAFGGIRTRVPAVARKRIQ